MHLIGAHVSTEGGVFNAPANAMKIGATAFALFTKNPRGYTSSPLKPADTDAFRKAMDDNGYQPSQIVPHDGYLVNLASPKPDIFEKSFASFIDELKRCEQLGLTCLNMHPGSSTGADVGAAIKRIIEAVNRGLDATRGVTVVLENTAGQGSTIGRSFEELAELIAGIEDKTRIGICYDTCHGFVAGYDIRTKPLYERTMKQLDDIVGRSYLRALHLNDAKGELGSNLDRHDSLGKGNLGLAPFRMLMNDARLDGIPMILETIDETIWDKEIAMLFGMTKKKSRN